MIVKDEGDFIEKCLNSIKDYVEEIIIVDTGSTDDTVEIAKRFTDKVFEHEWPDDFSKARNISLSYATKEWILVLDADEIISEIDLKKIRELINTEDEVIGGYVLIQRNYNDNHTLTNWTGCYKENKYTKDYKGYKPSKLTRLFRNKRKYEYRNQVHELVEYSIEEKGDRLVKTDVAIHHYGIVREQQIKDRKRGWYLELGEKQIQQDPKKERPYYETGVCYLIQEDYEDAIKKFEKVVELNPNYRDAYYNLGSAHHSLKQFDKAEEFLKKSIEVKPFCMAAYNLLGMIYQDQQRFQEAINVLVKGLRLRKDDLMLQTLGGIYVTVGKFEKAIEVLNIALELNPHNIGVLNNLGGAHFGLKQFDKSIEILKKIIEIDADDFAAYKNLAINYFYNDEKGKATDLLKNAKSIFPEQEKVIGEILKEIKK